MNRKIESLLLACGAALTLAGCATPTSQQDLSHSSPASPTAAEAAYPPATPFLMTGTNYAMSPQPEEQPMQHQQPQQKQPAKSHEHDGHNKAPSK